MFCVDLGESFQTHIFLQNSASIQPRTSPVKFARSLADTQLAAQLCAVPGTTTAPAKHTFFMSNGNDIDLPCLVLSLLSESEYEVVYSDQSLMD